MEGLKKTTIMDQETMQRTLKRIAHQIIENTDGAKELHMIGIQRRGVTIAKRIASYIKAFEGRDVPLGTLDITFYRDDLSKDSEQPVVSATHIDFDVNDKKIVLVDDVLYTGRTARAAMDAIMDMGRPDCIKFAVLIDRGHRELPIRADFVGKNVPTAAHEMISVKVMEFDNEESVDICDSKSDM
ncbi:MAG: bifunctional pyr operon transcriptional regulator/uracil phosphoribosyltransferase PyrR [Christensenella sp.]|uniref:bifunctional pyr operon transcriptional regulator/uracil phosphoribosyltransferase PyrR n=1 Tax=Christensenella sp. TaxID=1935934 RepID=UPI002B1F7E36|nr:bifunctional pyr operon transcriptional regulator/uracil phosphoribosyltransferase PyrR [Christensenella sp.]MEA5004572.1 bifunctional pyr operon transcriptional regulator/uracil phosphoribosyltransferase PyrR [Christensenella sp.]